MQKRKAKEMKVTIEFDGNEEQEDLRTALDGYKWKLAMWDLDQKLRSTTKYNYGILSEGDATETERKIAEKLREFIREILNNYNLNQD